MRSVAACEVLDNELLRNRFYLIRIFAPHVAGSAEPGQFVMLRSPLPDWPYLNRPFSIYDSDGDEVIEIVYKVVGRATGVMSALSRGDKIEIVGPLGTGFSAAEGILHMIAVAGGIGLPPVGFYCRRYAGVCESTTLVIGARTGDELLVPVGLMAEGIEILSFTEDGTKGERGLATDGLARVVGAVGVDPSAACIAACGPKQMLAEVHRIAEQAGLGCEVSVEEIMACGVGACMSCAVPASGGGYLHICTDGPVVESCRIDFDRWLSR